MLYGKWRTCSGKQTVRSENTGRNLKYRWYMYFQQPNIPVFRTLDMLSFKPSCILTISFHCSLFKVVGLNFSSATTPELLLKTFDHYCEYRRTPNGVVLAPVQLGKWLVLFCDEINLPDMDKYGTQRVISFIRQVCFSL